jgi:rhodanese-related sulfurtransferase
MDRHHTVIFAAPSGSRCRPRRAPGKASVRVFDGKDKMSEQVNMVDVETAIEWVQSGKAVVVDVRERNEYAVEHIPGAHLLPLSEFDPAGMPDVPHDRKLLIHCRSANRCGIAAAHLVANGYTGEINRLAGGLLAWVAAGGPVEPGE